MTVGVYGTGRLAGSLARALHDVDGHRLVGLSGRDATRAATLAEAVGTVALPPDELVAGADLVLVVVADVAIRAAAADLARVSTRGSAGHPAASGGWWAVHCSGALPPEALQPLAATGRALGAWHPMQAFPTDATPPAPGVTWTITADDARLAEHLAHLTRRLGGRPHGLAARHRAAYHAAAVLAANYPAALVAHAVAVLTDCGFTEREALAAALPLARSALDGLAAAGVPGGITGPVVRGDVATITSHLEALDGRPKTSALYRAAGLGTLPLAQAQGLSADTVALMRAALTDPRNLP